MSKFVLIEDEYVIQCQPYEEQGFIEAPDYVVSGYFYDGNDFTPPPILLDTIKTIKKSQLKNEMYRVLLEGFRWRASNNDDWFTISIDDDMQGFLTRTLLKLNEGRIDPHNGFIRSNGVNVNIDDVGIKEVCLFAGIWGDEISSIRISALDSVVDWHIFDPFAIDWSVNWTGSDASNGWNNNTLTQSP